MDRDALHLAPLLDQLVNYERSRPDRRLWDLTTMRGLVEAPWSPEPPRPAVQIGGSKGKGTTAALLAALCRAAGRRPGLYTSPHLHSLRERIRVDGADIALHDLEPLLRTLLARATGPRTPTFFEAMTWAALAHFAEQRVDLAIYEVGLGGRHDATSALPVDAGIVTHIELEHTDVLGDTIAQIAGEKAPVIRPGGLGFTATHGEALAVVRAHAAAVGARLLVAGEHFGLADARWAADGLHGRLWLPDGRELPVHLPDARTHEATALVLAAAAFTQLLPGAPLVLDPAPRPDLPCRFEVHVAPDGVPWVLDGAHTEQSLGLLAAELQRRWPGQSVAVLFASATGKRWREGLSRLLPIADRFVVTELSGTTSEDPALLAAHLAAAGARCERAADVEAGLAALRRHPGPRVVTGSFYLAAAARALLGHAPR